MMQLRKTGGLTRGAARMLGCLVVCVGAAVWSGGIPSSNVLLAQEAKKPLGSKVKEAIDLVDQEPFDRLFLDDFNEKAQIDIVPLLEIPKKPFPDKGMLIFDLMDGSWPTLQVPWENVEDYKTFNDLLAEEAETLISQREYAHAFRNLLFVLDNGEAGNPKIEARLQSVLFLDGKDNYDKGNYALALSIFEDLYRRNPRARVPGISLSLIDLILDCYDRNVKQFFGADEFASARALLASVRDTYKKESTPLIERWSAEFQKLADEMLVESERQLAAKRPREARIAARRAINILPDMDAAYALYDRVVTEYPIVFVGTSQPATDPNPNRIEDWASRRVGRLTQRRIVELTGLSDEGGRYEFTNGRILQTDDQGLNFRFQFDREYAESQFGVPRLEAYELASILLRQADPRNPKHVTAWAKILKSVAVTGENSVDIQLKMPFVRPEALLSFAYGDYEKNSDDNTGPYVRVENDDQYQSYQVNPRYKASEGTQYPQLIEWLYANPSEAVDALRKGAVDAVDRIPPSDLAKLRAEPDIEVRSYLVPTVHMLVPNLRTEFNRNPTFRSALLKGINRELILKSMLCGGLEIDGSVTIDGPFPIGMDDNQQIAYAYNTRIAPIQFSRLIGAVFVEVVRQSIETKKISKGEKDVKVVVPTVILAYPQGDVSGVACRAIKTAWEALGVKTTLRQLPPGVTVPEDDDYDFLYVELTMTEPLADANFLFGTAGIVKDLSAPVEQMMRSVNISNSWRSASNNLRQLHRQALNDVAILPLWQMREHFAYRRNLRNIGRDLMYLYQFVDRWQIGPLRETE